MSPRLSFMRVIDLGCAATVLANFLTRSTRWDSVCRTSRSNDPPSCNRSEHFHVQTEECQAFKVHFQREH